MKYFIAILATFIIGATAQAEVKVYCVQISPKNSHGLIFEEATLTSSAGKAKLVPGRFGFGLTTEQGDGTISQDMLLESNRALSPSPAHSASSAQWKNAVPFLLPIEGAEYVAYFPAEAFGGELNDFKARVKVTGTSEKNYILTCNLL